MYWQYIKDTELQYSMPLSIRKILPPRHCSIETWDFARLYTNIHTNIPLKDLMQAPFVHKALFCMRGSFTHESGYCHRSLRYGKASWNTGGRVTERASFRFSDEERLRAALDTVINGTFLVVEGTNSVPPEGIYSLWYHQDRGIPMGIDYAIHMAD